MTPEAMRSSDRSFALRPRLEKQTASQHDRAVPTWFSDPMCRHPLDAGCDVVLARSARLCLQATTAARSLYESKQRSNDQRFVIRSHASTDHEKTRAIEPRALCSRVRLRAARLEVLDEPLRDRSLRSRSAKRRASVSRQSQRSMNDSAQISAREDAEQQQKRLIS
jgi:hypothetical protein